MFPRDMVCLRNISVDTLHKGDTEDYYFYYYYYYYVIIIIIIIITKLRNYRKQPYWALHTYFGKC